MEPRPRGPFCIGQNLEFVKVENLGEGTHAVVDLVKITKPVPSPRFLAVKSSPSPSSSLRKEGRILRNFGGCPSIVQCHGEFVTTEYDVEYDNLFLEYVSGGNLLDLIYKYGGKIPEPDVRRYTMMILEGLYFVHKKGYVHCDIKPENILVSPLDESGSRFILKLADFGSAKEPGEQDPNQGCFRGTAPYMSPESVKHGQITTALDIWSLGCVVVEMMTGLHPWESPAEDSATRNACSRDVPHIPQDMSVAGTDFLNKCFHMDPRQRWTVDNLIWHPFVFN
ncbi:mitogen-activated protein kinase kinase kinase 21 [Hibiscus trionum]|uniref:Mitogen-activated protein kinase kinase kinase 21 n=1 Tax=Hibiscus trionum TaxID=183268 RepID=A0A9W7J0L1_HIBTR|nr:mitogen-activated protein kinase kinase kinase 21 [Hibiscus trionum]